MSLATDRAAIAATLSTVDDVTGYEYRPKTPKPGDAWPLMPSLELQDGLVWRPTWTIHVFLPQDERKASGWMDTHFTALADALRGGNTFPDSAEPALIATSGGDQYVLEITVRSH
ncbi:hypothetical protein F8280_12110 [Micromonospora noduli]|uniref:hypothetical protein n=1 Tax=Micromonospora noduli TaxID=709876 RepID=UPI00124B11A8|nr:hypothetical protein [Micromonospora noduli]KAB1925147.1 hypothetical protein F8280_12110 [Micromonospora noduli]